MPLLLRFSSLRRGALGVLAGAVLLASCSGSTDGLLSQDLFERTCAICHGSSGEGAATRPALNAGSNAARLSDEQIRGVISVGPGAMPSFSARLSEEQIDSLIDYLRQLQGAAAGD